MDHDAPSVVVHVGESAADALGLLDDPVEALGAGVGDVLGEGYQDGQRGAPRLPITDAQQAGFEAIAQRLTRPRSERTASPRSAGPAILNTTSSASPNAVSDRGAGVRSNDVALSTEYPRASVKS